VSALLVGRDLIIILATVAAYYGLLALALRRAFSLPPQRAALWILGTLPLRLALVGLGVVWLIRARSLWGVLVILLGMLAGQFVFARWIRAKGLAHGD
jgi:hypothetical protein